jgi:hypothetical protein
MSPGLYSWTGRGGPSNSSPLPYHLSFMVGLVEEVSSSMVSELRSWVQFSSAYAFSSAVRNNFHLPCCLLRTHMARARGCDSHAGGGMLDYNIRGPLAPSISPRFFGRTSRGSLSSMVPEPRSWVQFLLATHFLLLRVIIFTYLTVC